MNYKPAPEFIRRRYANRKTAMIAAHIRSNGYAQSLPKEQADLDWIVNALKFMEGHNPHVRQTICDQTGLSMPELRELIFIQECRVIVSRRTQRDYDAHTRFFENLKLELRERRVKT